MCGYDRCERALEFHHRDENEKEFGISDQGRTISFERKVAEVKKCIMVCANCHREIHDGILLIEDLIPIFIQELAEKYLMEVEQNRCRRVQMDKCSCGNDKPASQPFCSLKCAGANRKPVKLKLPDADLISLYEQHNNYEAVGRELNVTGAAIKRRLKKIEC